MGQPQVAIEESVPRPLTTLSEDEQMFRDSVREFAEGEIRKRVAEMDEQSHLDPAPSVDEGHVQVEARRSRHATDDFRV